MVYCTFKTFETKQGRNTHVAQEYRSIPEEPNNAPIQNIGPIFLILQNIKCGIFNICKYCQM